jgi:hypothetical protein
VRAGGRQRLEYFLGAVQHAGLQVILREREAGLFALRGLERLARRDVLVDLDGAVNLPATPVQAAERKMGFDRIAGQKTLRRNTRAK